MLFTQLMAQLKMKISLFIGDANVTPGQMLLAFERVGAAFGLLRHLSLDRSHAGQVMLEEERGFNRLSAIRGQEDLETEVETAAYRHHSTSDAG